MKVFLRTLEKDFVPSKFSGKEDFFKELHAKFVIFFENTCSGFFVRE